MSSDTGGVRLFLIFLWVQVAGWAVGLITLGIGLAIFGVITWHRLIDVALLCVEVWLGGFALLLLSVFVPTWIKRKDAAP